MTEKDKGFYSKFLKKYSSETEPVRLYHMTPAGFPELLAGTKIEPKWEGIPDKVIICDHFCNALTLAPHEQGQSTMDLPHEPSKYGGCTK